MLLRGLADLNETDDAVNMGDFEADDLSDLADAQNTADSEALDVATSSSSSSSSSSGSSSSFDWGGLLKTGAGVITSIFGKSKTPARTSSSLPITSATAAQAAATRNTLLIGGLAAAAVVGVLLLRGRRARA